MSARQYIEYAFFLHLLSGSFDKKYTGRWLPIDELDGLLEEALYHALKEYGYSPSDRYSDLINRVREKLKPALQVEGDEFTGEFIYIPVDPKDKALGDLLTGNPVGDRLEALGDEARQRAYREVARREGWTGAEADASNAVAESAPIAAPASDRIVTFSDNQITDLDAQVTEVIDAVSSQNQIGGETGLRELILGQLKAGRELIRAGSVRLHLLELALIEALKMLAIRYEKETIGALASTLLAALAHHVGLA